MRTQDPNLSGDEPSLSALIQIVARDPDPKARRRASIALGRLRDPEAVDTLADALGRESVRWVRRSLILALGATGGPAAREALEATEPADDDERQTLRKALDRSDPRRSTADWNRDAVEGLPLLLEAPPGLEGVAIREAAQHGLGSLTLLGPGILRPPPELRPWHVLPALRCIYGLLIDAGSGPALPLDQPAQCAPLVRDMIARSDAIASLRSWLSTDDPVIRYRFGMKGSAARPPGPRFTGDRSPARSGSGAHSRAGGPRVARDALATVLDAVRRACEPLGLTDSPSNYHVEISLIAEPDSTRLFVRPSFMPDLRFAYRRRDVGASIHPVVAACLARLVRTSAQAVAFDPVCGSGTLLVERALLDEPARGLGLDVSPTAVSASHANVSAAGLDGRIRVELGDAFNPARWPACDEVLANLPFGLRTHREETDLVQLYGAILDRLANNLRPGGRAVLYTARRQALESGLAAVGGRLQVDRRLRVQSGGLWSHVWVLRPGR